MPAFVGLRRLMGGAPSWLLDPNVAIDMDFTTRRVWGASLNDLSVTTASGGYAQKLDGTWQSFAANTARITDKGLLVEEQRTNSIRNNSGQGGVVGTTSPVSGGSIGTAGTTPTNWNLANGSGLIPYVVGTGTENGVDYVDVRWVGTASATTTLASSFEDNTTVTASAAQVWAHSLFLKLVSGTVQAPKILVGERVAGGGFNASNYGSSGTLGSIASTLTRYSTVATLVASTASIKGQFEFGLTNGVAYDFTIRIGWPQLELGAFATSPIRTTTAAATRASDVIYLPITAPASAATLFAQFTRNAPDSSAANENPAFLSDGTANNRFGFFRPLSTTQLAFRSTAAGVTTNPGNSATGTVSSGARIKAILAGSASDIQGAVGGALPTVGALPAAFPAGMTRLYLGLNAAAGEHLQGYVERVALWNTRLANASLQSLTS